MRTCRSARGAGSRLLGLPTACALLGTALWAADFSGRCVGVGDGDTISVLREGREVKVRMEGIDCPELHQDFGTRAKQFTSALVFGRAVRVSATSRDRYDRIVGRVRLDGKDLSLELVKAGLAWYLRRRSPDPQLVQAEAKARTEKRGLWSIRDPVPPWLWRKKHRRR